MFLGSQILWCLLFSRLSYGTFSGFGCRIPNVHRRTNSSFGLHKTIKLWKNTWDKLPISTDLAGYLPSTWWHTPNSSQHWRCVTRTSHRLWLTQFGLYCWRRCFLLLESRNSCFVLQGSIFALKGDSVSTWISWWWLFFFNQSTMVHQHEKPSPWNQH